MDLLFIITLYLVFIILITVSVIYRIVRYKTPPKDYAPNPIKLSKESTLATSFEVKDNFQLPSASSIIVMLKLLPGDKTSDITGNMRPLLFVGGFLLFEISPTSRKISREFTKSDNSLNTTAQIRIGTYGENGFEIEQITLPDLPLQKWVCLGILREGRRIDVIYDTKIVASRRLNNNIPTQPYSGLQIGKNDESEKTGLLGTVHHAFILPYRLNINEFSTFRDGFISPDGNLIQKENIPIPFYNVGIPNVQLSLGDSVSSPPGNTLKKWYTPYQ